MCAHNSKVQNQHSALNTLLLKNTLYVPNKKSENIT